MRNLSKRTIVIHEMRVAFALGAYDAAALANLRQDFPETMDGIYVYECLHTPQLDELTVLCGLGAVSAPEKLSLKTKYPTVQWDAFTEATFKKAVRQACKDPVFFTELHRLIHMCYDPIEAKEWHAFASRRYEDCPVGLYMRMATARGIDSGIRLTLQDKDPERIPMHITKVFPGLVVGSPEGAVFTYKP